MSALTPDPSRTPEQKASDQIAKSWFGVDDAIPGSRAGAVRGLLVGAAQCAVLIPAIFYLRFGHVTAIGTGTTVFFVAYCLLAAVGLYFRPRTEYHTTVRPRGDWKDRIGAFWLVACVFGPLFGWIVTEALPITAGSWRALYVTRVVLAAGLPVLCALPLMRYVRGKAAWVAGPLLIVVTLLPVSSAVSVSQDLWDGPTPHLDSYRADYLPHTGRSIRATP